MKQLTILYLFLITLLSSGLSFCNRDAVEDVSPRLLLKMQGEADGRYRSHVDIFLGSAKESFSTIEINTNYKWYIDELCTVPLWCQLSRPANALNINFPVSGHVTDKTLTFIVRIANPDPTPRSFTLVLRHVADPSLTATINITQGGLGDGLDIEDVSPYEMVAQFKAEGQMLLSGLGPVGTPEVFHFKVLTTLPWTLKMTPDKTNKNEPLSSWMSVKIDGGATAGASGNDLLLSGEGETTLIVSVDPNTSTRYARYANMSLQTQSAQIIVPIEQQTQTAYLEILQGVIPVGATFSIAAYDQARANRSIILPLEFTSNRNWEITGIVYDPADGNWLSLTPTSGSLNQAYGLSYATGSLTALENPALTSRSATVTFKGSYMRGTALVEDLTRVITVTQAAFVPAGPTAIIVEEFAGTNAKAHTVSFPCNYAFTITGGGPGFSAGTPIYNDGTKEWEVLIQAANNTNRDNGRTATFTIAADNLAYSDHNANISVSQDKEWWVVVTTPANNATLSFPNSFSAPAAKSIVFDGYLGGAGTWTATHSGSFNTFTPTNGVITGTKSISVGPTGQWFGERNWTVTITASHPKMQTDIVRTVSVRQN